MNRTILLYIIAATIQVFGLWTILAVSLSTRDMSEYTSYVIGVIFLVIEILILFE